MYIRLLLIAATLAGVGLACQGSSTGSGLESSTISADFDYEGVEYLRLERSDPRPMVIHVFRIDLRAAGIRTQVTPADREGDLPLNARQTSQFLENYSLQIALNGDGFTPWHDYGLLGYRPHPGDAVDVLGFAASEGQTYSQPRDDVPTLYFTRTGRAVFNQPPSKIYQAISGLEMILQAGAVLPDLADDPEPRTAIGLDRSGRTLILVVIDGRQTAYSEGATLPELAQVLEQQGAHNGMNMDGGGSTTLAVSDEMGKALLVNSPVHQGISGRERPVANHLGIYAKRP